MMRHYTHFTMSLPRFKWYTFAKLEWNPSWILFMKIHWSPWCHLFLRRLDGFPYPIQSQNDDNSMSRSSLKSAPAINKIEARKSVQSWTFWINSIFSALSPWWGNISITFVKNISLQTIVVPEIQLNIPARIGSVAMVSHVASVTTSRVSLQYVLWYYLMDPLFVSSTPSRSAISASQYSSSSLCRFRVGMNWSSLDHLLVFINTLLGRDEGIIYFYHPVIRC